MDFSPQEEFNELSYYTMGHSDMVNFIHQHAVDAFQAQTADKKTKPLTLTFSRMGLYLYLEKGYTGHEVQLAHLKLAQNKKSWIVLKLPGQQRDLVINAWCTSVWMAYKNWHELIANLAKSELRLQ